MVRRLDVLKTEMETIKNLRCMTYNDKVHVLEHYQHEIDCIVLYGSNNPIYEED